MAALSGAQTAELVSAVLQRYGNDELHFTITNEIPTLAKEVVSQVQVDGEVGVVNIGNVALGSTSFLPGAGLLTKGASITPSQGTVLSSVIFTRLAIDRRIFSGSKNPADGVNMVEAQMDAGVDDIKCRFGRALFRAQLNVGETDGYLAGIAGGAVTADTATASPTDGVYVIAQKDLSGYRFGQSVHVKDESQSDVYVLSVSDLVFQGVGAISGAVAGLVTLKNDIPGVAGATNHTDSDLPVLELNRDSIWLRGYFNEESTVLGVGGTAVLSAALPNSLYDVSGSGDLHGITGGTKGWRGIRRTAFGALTQGKLLTVAAQIKAQSGMQPTHLIAHPVAVALYAQDAVNATAGADGGGRRIVDGKMSKYDAIFDEWESGVQFMAKPVIAEPNCPAQDAVLHNRDGVDLLVWKDFDFEREGDKIAMTDRDRYIFDVQISGEANLHVAKGKRNCMAYIQGITGV